MAIQNAVDGQTQDAQMKALERSKKNQENQEGAKALSDFNALVAKLNQ